MSMIDPRSNKTAICCGRFVDAVQDQHPQHGGAAWGQGCELNSHPPARLTEPNTPNRASSPVSGGGVACHPPLWQAGTVGNGVAEPGQNPGQPLGQRRGSWLV